MIWAFSSSDATKAHRARQQFLDFLKLRAAPETDYASCELIFGELIGNVVQHAPGRIRIVVDWNGDEAVLCVEDSGELFHFDPALPENPFSESGRGLFLVTALTRKSIDVQRFPAGKSICVVLPVHARRA